MLNKVILFCACNLPTLLFQIIRLTPVYMLVIMVGTVALPYMIRGAMQPEGNDVYMAGCRTKWWTNLLYVNNYVTEDMVCVRMYVSIYVTEDMVCVRIMWATM